MDKLKIEGRNLFEAWRNLNDAFISYPGDENMLMPGRDFSYVWYNTELEAKGFGLPENPPPFCIMDKRIALLEKRYIDPELWKEGIDRLIERRDRATGSQPNSFTVLFHRRATNERKVPAGGGCLISLNFTWWNKGWHLHVLSRASEITNRLLSDSYFVKYAVDKVVAEAGLKKWDPDTVHINWTLLLPAQMKYMVFPYLLYTQGEEAVVSFVTSKPENAWQEVVIDHFWREFIQPERITWAQRRKWSEKFIKETPGVDWPKMISMFGPKDLKPIQSKGGEEDDTDSEEDEGGESEVSRGNSRQLESKENVVPVRRPRLGLRKSSRAVQAGSRDKR